MVQNESIRHRNWYRAFTSTYLLSSQSLPGASLTSKRHGTRRRRSGKATCCGFNALCACFRSRCHQWYVLLAPLTLRLALASAKGGGGGDDCSKQVSPWFHPAPHIDMSICMHCVSVLACLRSKAPAEAYLGVAAGRALRLLLSSLL